MKVVRERLNISLFGAILVVAIAALLIYRDYIHSTNPFSAAPDITNVRAIPG